MGALPLDTPYKALTRARPLTLTPEGGIKGLELRETPSYRNPLLCCARACVYPLPARGKGSMLTSKKWGLTSSPISGLNYGP